MTVDLSAYDPLAHLEAYNPDRFTVTEPPSNAPTKAEESLAKELTEGFLMSIAVTKTLDWLGFAKRWQKHGWNDTHAQTNISNPFVQVFAGNAVQTLLKAAQDGHLVATEAFGLSHAVAVGLDTWSQVYAYRMGGLVAAAQQKALQDAVNDMINQRLPPQVIAERASAMYGLDPQSAQAYARYATNKTMARSETLPQVLSRLLYRRARTIGSTEVYTARNFGGQIRLMEAKATGEIPSTAKKRWVTAHDERVCPVCGPMDGIEVHIEDSFEVVMPIPKTSKGKGRKSSRLVVPPVHPNCRCSLELAEPKIHSDQDLFTIAKRDYKRDRTGKFSSTGYQAAGALTGSVVVGTAGYKGYDKVESGRQSKVFVEGEDGAGYWPHHDDELNFRRWEKRFGPNTKPLYRGINFHLDPNIEMNGPQDLMEQLHESGVFDYDKARHFGESVDHISPYLREYNGRVMPVVLHLPAGTGHSAEAKPAFDGKVRGVHGVKGRYDIGSYELGEHPKFGKYLKITMTAAHR